jgi:DtxR family Mn-dependent transcriptional regulator
MLSGKRSRPRKMTASNEHYLRAIWGVRARRGYARLADVARELGITPPTLSLGIKALEARGLVLHDDHRFLLLSEAGEHAARAVHHRFAVTHAFLHQVLGISEPLAREEACRLEHEVSGETAERLVDLLRLLREDHEFREFFERRFTEYQRDCRMPSDCSTCDLACLLPALPGTEEGPEL